ncbi:MAG: AI-2E family transporter [Candidatus Moranbacteria bacterium]|nr:AI-2E family transporter [Candidatus Moranbacteria bacterium]
MKLKNYNIYFFFAVLFGISVLAYMLFRPFFIPFLIAVILAQLFSPIYERLLAFLRKEWLSSAVTCLLILLIIILPVILILSLAVGEIQGLISAFSRDPNMVGGFIDGISSHLASLSFGGIVDWQKIINQDSLVSALKNSTQAILFILQNTYAGVAYFAFASFIMFFTLFYLLIDGRKLLERIMELSPLEDKHEHLLISRFNSITRATIRGGIFIAIIQGALGASIFFLTGVSSPIFLGMLMMITSIIPPLGSGLVWFPVGITMIILGHVGAGIAILLFGILVISTIDNFIRPKLIGKDTELHPLLILFSTLGGIALFGALGFIVGPIIMSLFVSLWDIYALEFKTQLREFNK